MKSRRVKIVSICTHDLLDLFSKFAPQFFHLPKIDGLPDGYDVLSVTANWQNRVIDFQVTHPSFPEVADGDMPPRIEGVQRVVYERRDDESTPYYVRATTS